MDRQLKQSKLKRDKENKKREQEILEKERQNVAGNARQQAAQAAIHAKVPLHRILPKNTMMHVDPFPSNLIAWLKLLLDMHAQILVQGMLICRQFPEVQHVEKKNWRTKFSVI